MPRYSAPQRESIRKMLTAYRDYLYWEKVMGVMHASLVDKGASPVADFRHVGQVLMEQLDEGNIPFYLHVQDERDKTCEKYIELNNEAYSLGVSTVTLDKVTRLVRKTTAKSTSAISRRAYDFVRQYFFHQMRSFPSHNETIRRLSLASDSKGLESGPLLRMDHAVRRARNTLARRMPPSHPRRGPHRPSH